MTPPDPALRSAPSSPPPAWSAFGFEWRRAWRFGLEGEAEVAGFDPTALRDAYREHLLAHTVAAFWRKTLLAPDEVRGARVLDAGCGNGRYAVAAALAGAAAVLAVDPSDAADIAWANTAELPNVVARRGDIASLDLPAGSFDVIFSIGVLQHMADPAAAVRRLAPLLADGGILSIHVYRKRNPVSRAVNGLLRAVTTRLPHGLLWKLCAVPTAVGRLTMCSRYLHAAVNAVAACYPNRSQNFDWYAPRPARQFEPGEVRRWLADAGLADLADDDPYARADSFYNRLYPRWLKRRDGRLRPWVRWFFGPMALTVRGRKPRGR